MSRPSASAEMQESAARIADYGVDELSSYGLGRMRAQRLAALSCRSRRTAVLRPHRPRDARGTVASRCCTSAGATSGISGATRLSSTGAPRSRGRSTGPRQSDRMGVRLRRRFGFQQRRADVLRGRTPRSWRNVGLEIRPAATGDRAPARRTDARHRRHDPARPGRSRPRRPRHVALHPGSARHRQDRSRAPPSRVSAVTPIPSAAPVQACWSSDPTTPSSTTSRKSCRRSARRYRADHGR